MNRDEQRCQPLLLNPLPVGITEVGECEIGAVEKTESIVIILEVETCLLYTSDAADDC